MTNAGALRKSKQISLSILCAITLLAVQVNSVMAADQDPDDVEYPLELVADIHKGGAASLPKNLTVIGNTLFFRADDGIHGQELWKSYPPYTETTTVMISDIQPGIGSSWPEELFALGDILFFRADNGNNGQELWKSEPPYTSTEQILDINAGAANSGPTDFYTIGNGLFFRADDGSSGNELWKSFPPYTTASRVADIWDGSGSSTPRYFSSIGWVLFFNANDSTGRELWKSEPPYDQANTTMVMDIYPGHNGNSDPQELTVMGTTLFFTAFEEEHGKEIWRTDPPYDQWNTERAQEIKKLFPSTPYDLEAVGDTLFYTANVGSIGFELFKTIPPYRSTYSFPVQDIYTGSTGMLPNSSLPHQKTSIGSTLFFTATTAEEGEELWVSMPPYDEDHTSLLFDFRAGSASSNTIALKAVGNSLFFTANDGDETALWRTRAPFTEYEQVTDLPGGGHGHDPYVLTVIGNTLFVVVNDGEHGIEIMKYHTGEYLPDTGFAPGVVTEIDPLNYEAYQNIGGMVLDIPAMNLQTDLVGVSEAVDGWNLTWLWDQAGYLNGTAFPTLEGNTVITGHLYLPDGTPGPFNDLGKLRWGDLIRIEAWGSIYEYEIREMLVTDPSDISVMGHEELDWITLITCKDYDAATDSYLSRQVVRAVLVNVR